MQKLINSLCGKAIKYPILLLIIISSCKKNPVDNGHGGTTTAPILTVISDTPFNGEKSNINWTANQVVTVGEQTGISGSFKTDPLTSPKTITITAVNANGSDTKLLTISVYPLNLTFLCWDNSLQQYAKWLNTSYQFTRTDIISWQSGNLDCKKYGYRPNGTRLMFVDGCDGNPNHGVFTSSYGPAGEVNKINMGGSLNDNIWNVDSMDATTLVLSQIKQDSDGITRWRVLTFKKVT